MLVACFVRIDIQPDARSPQEQHRCEDGGQDDRAQDERAGEAERADEHVRQTGGIAFLWLRDIDHHRSVGLLLKRREYESGKQFPVSIVLFPGVGRERQFR